MSMQEVCIANAPVLLRPLLVWPSFSCKSHVNTVERRASKRSSSNIPQLHDLQSRRREKEPRARAHNTAGLWELPQATLTSDPRKCNPSGRWQWNLTGRRLGNALVPVSVCFLKQKLFQHSEDLNLEFLKSHRL